MKHCPKCRVESRDDAEWCWHCGYAYEDAEVRASPAIYREDQPDADPDPDVSDPP